MKKLFSLLFVFLGVASGRAFCQTELIASGNEAVLEYSKLRIGVQAGYGFRLGKTDKSLGNVERAHLNSLRWGPSFGADFTCFINEGLGFGLKVNDIRGSASDYVTVTYNDSSTASGVYKDDIDIWFVGPVASFRTIGKDRRSALFCNVGLGWLGFYDNAMLIVPYEVKGSTLGLMYELGLDFNLTDQVSLGAGLSYYSGSLSEIRSDIEGTMRTYNLDGDDQENVSHITLQFGLRVNL